MAAIGTTRTCRGRPTMSVDRGKPESAGWRSIRRDLTHCRRARPIAAICFPAADAIIVDVEPTPARTYDTVYSCHFQVAAPSSR
jgi:hypothetical protein